MLKFHREEATLAALSSREAFCQRDGVDYRELDFCVGFLAMLGMASH